MKITEKEFLSRIIEKHDMVRYRQFYRGVMSDGREIRVDLDFSWFRIYYKCGVKFQHHLQGGDSIRFSPELWDRMGKKKFREQIRTDVFNRELQKVLDI